MTWHKLLDQIHSRSIWQVTLLYLGISWAVVGHVDLLISRLGFPEQLFAAVVALMLVGLLSLVMLVFWSKIRLPLWAVAKAGIAYGIVSWFVLGVVDQLADRAVVPEIIFRTTLAVTFVIFPCLVIVVVLRAVRARDRRPDPPWTPKLVALAAGAAAVVLAWTAFEIADQLRVRGVITESAFRWTIYILVVIAFVLILAAVARTVRAVRRSEAVSATQKADAVLVHASESTAEPPPRGEHITNG